MVYDLLLLRESMPPPAGHERSYLLQQKEVIFFQCVCPAASGMIYSFIPSMQNVCACPDQGFIERHPRQLKQTVTDAIWSLSNGCCLKRCHSNLNTNRMRSQSANSYERQMYKNSWHNPPP